jgi:hypothetical protein
LHRSVKLPQAVKAEKFLSQRNNIKWHE